MVEQPKCTTASATKANIDLEASHALSPPGVKAPATAHANKMTKTVTLMVALSIISIILLVGALVPTILLVATESSTATKSSTILTDIEVHSKRGSTTVHSAFDLSSANANARWHLMVRLESALSSSSEALGEALEATHDQDEEGGCLHLLHADGRIYRFKSPACTYDLQNITQCSAREYQHLIHQLPSEISVDELVTLMNSGQTNKSRSTFTTDGTTAVLPDGDEAFVPPLICSYEPSPEGYISNASAQTKPMEMWTAVASDVLATAISAFSDDEARNDVAQEVSPEGFFCFDFVDLSFKGMFEVTARTRTAYGPAGTDGSCKAQTQVSFSTCYGFWFWGNWGPWNPWPWSADNQIFHASSPFQDTVCKCEHDHILEIDPKGVATPDGPPFIVTDHGCNGNGVIHGKSTRTVGSTHTLMKSTTLSTGTSSTNTYTMGASISVGFKVLGIGADVGLNIAASFANTVTNNEATTEAATVTQTQSCSNTLSYGDNPAFLTYSVTRQRYKQPVTLKYKQCSASSVNGVKTFTSIATKSATVYADHVQSQGSCGVEECTKGKCTDSLWYTTGTGCY